MDINYEKLKEAIEKFAKPCWEGKDKVWVMRPGGGEVYIQEEVLANAAPHMREENLRENAKESTTNAMLSQVNLLSQYDMMFAKSFLDRISEGELRDHMLALIYGPEDLLTRLKRFLNWSKVEAVPGEEKIKAGINATVCSYFLAVSDARQYPYCKPVAYNSAVRELLGKAAIKGDPAERIVQCKDVYSEVLKLLEKEYGLQNGNFFDVHSLFYFFQHKNKEDGLSVWDKIKQPFKPSSEASSEVSPTPRMDNLIYDLLMEKHNVILYGPPGTGKTREALLLAGLWGRTYGEDAISQLTFHPSYSYEDFIEGFRPTADGSGFELRDGVFKTICKEASRNPGKKYLVIIDEINRGDVARILGELITLIEGDKRGEKYSTVLQQSGERFYVPGNVYVLGTMNTADKSISLMDLAIRRRFRFCYFPPDLEVLSGDKDFYDKIKGVTVSHLLYGINQRLMDVGIDRDRVLGHSFFLIGREVTNPLDMLRNNFIYEIIPLIEEYCYSDRSLMTKVLGDLVDAGGSVNTEVIDDDERFTAALRGLSDIR